MKQGTKAEPIPLDDSDAEDAEEEPIHNESDPTSSLLYACQSVRDNVQDQRRCTTSVLAFAESCGGSPQAKPILSRAVSCAILLRFLLVSMGFALRF